MLISFDPTVRIKTLGADLQSYSTISFTIVLYLDPYSIPGSKRGFFVDQSGSAERILMWAKSEFRLSRKPGKEADQ